jgi:hypothetical protein
MNEDLVMAEAVLAGRVAVAAAKAADDAAWSLAHEGNRQRRRALEREALRKAKASAAE